MASITPKNGREDFITAQNPHTYWELNSTNLGTNFGRDDSGNDDNTNVGSGDISTQESYEGMNSNNNPPASGWMDIYIITDAAMLLYIPAELTHSQVYGLFHNGGGTHAQAGFLRATETGVEICCTHNASGTPQDNVIHEIPDEDLPGWFVVSFQYCSEGGAQGDMGLWINGVKVRSGTRTAQLRYGSGNPQLGDSNADHPLAASCLDPSPYGGGNWGAEATINGSGILIANFTCDNPDKNNTSPDGGGDDWHEDYYTYHTVSDIAISSHTYFKTCQHSGSSHVALGWTWNSGNFNYASGMCSFTGSGTSWKWYVISSSSTHWYPSGNPTRWIWVSGSYMGGGRP